MGELAAGATGLQSRRDQPEWMPKPRAVATMFGPDAEELPVLPRDEVISLDGLDDDDGTRPRTSWTKRVPPTARRLSRRTNSAQIARSVGAAAAGRPLVVDPEGRPSGSAVGVKKGLASKRRSRLPAMTVQLSK